MTLPVPRPQFPDSDAMHVARAILETLAYFDVFDYPVRLPELHRYLHGLSRSASALEADLSSPMLAHRIEVRDGHICLAGRSDIVHLRRERKALFERILPRLASYSRLLGTLPFIRMVALTGSSAMQNGDTLADLDLMLVTAPDRLWLARLFVLIIGRWTAARRIVLCPNVIVSERRLVWPEPDLYTAHELAQMIPLAGLDAYLRLRDANRWVLGFLPNALGAPPSPLPVISASSRRRPLERLLHGRLGVRLEKWEMDRKISRLARQGVASPETFFSADVCQGNFHQHGHRTRLAFQQRLASLGLEPSFAAPLPSSPVILPA